MGRKDFYEKAVEGGGNTKGSELATEMGPSFSSLETGIGEAGCSKKT